MGVMVYFLGTGSDYPTRFREPVCVYVKAIYGKGHANILFDCSPNVLGQLDKLYMSPEEIDAVILSHLHWSHCCGIVPLLWANAIFGRVRPLYIFAPETAKDIHKDFEKYYPDTYRDRCKFEFEPVLLEIPKKGEIKFKDVSEFFPGLGTIKLEWCSVPHTIPCLGYALTFEEWRIEKPLKISYVVDAMVDIESEQKLVRNSTLLIRDCSFETAAKRWAERSFHATASEVGDLIGRSDINAVALVHLHPTRQSWGNGIINKIVTEVENASRAAGAKALTRILMPNDLDAYDLHSIIPDRPEYTRKARFNFDVAISYASEDRLYVEECAISLARENVKVFYDRFEDIKLWGKDLIVQLEEVFKEKAKCSVIFISKHYINKIKKALQQKEEEISSPILTELQSALERALQEKKEYILFVKLDESQISELFGVTKVPPSIARIKYIDVQKEGIIASKLAQMIYEKLEKSLDQNENQRTTS